jgi:hypothetical protein
MREGTASHSELVWRLNALVDDPSSKHVYHVHFHKHPPLSCIEAPVTTYTFAVLKDIKYLNMWKRLGDSVVSNFRRTAAEGLVGSELADVSEDVQAVLFLSGWKSVEVCFNCAPPMSSI